MFVIDSKSLESIKFYQWIGYFKLFQCDLVVYTLKH